MSNNPNNFSKYPNKDVSKMSGNVISFPSDSDQYLKKIKVILNETISGLENLDQFKKYLDSDVIKTSCEECSFSLNQINKMDLNEPRDFAQLISIRDNLIALRRLILIKISDWWINPDLSQTTAITSHEANHQFLGPRSAPEKLGQDIDQTLYGARMLKNLTYAQHARRPIKAKRPFQIE